MFINIFNPFTLETLLRKFNFFSIDSGFIQIRLLLPSMFLPILYAFKIHEFLISNMFCIMFNDFVETSSFVVSSSLTMIRFRDHLLRSCSSSRSLFISSLIGWISMFGFQNWRGTNHLLKLLKIKLYYVEIQK